MFCFTTDKSWSFSILMTQRHDIYLTISCLLCLWGKEEKVSMVRVILTRFNQCVNRLNKTIVEVWTINTRKLTHAKPLNVFKILFSFNFLLRPNGFEHGGSILDNFQWMNRNKIIPIRTRNSTTTPALLFWFKVLFLKPKYQFFTKLGLFEADQSKIHQINNIKSCIDLIKNEIGVSLLY